MRGQSASFNDLGKGFQHFSPAFLVTLLSGLFFLPVPIGVKLLEMRLDEIERNYPGLESMPDKVVIETFAFVCGLGLLYVIAFLVTGVIFAFAYQLVVEKNLSGWQATKLSARAARENFGGVVALVSLELVLSTFGIMLCCFGLVLVMPLTKASWAIAYSQVFLTTPQPIPTPGPPPPPTFYGNTPA